MTTKTRLTLEEFLRRPETKPASEYDDGEVYRKPIPSTWHGYIQRLLSYVLTLYLKAHQIGDAGSEIRCVFGPHGGRRAYVPDYLFIRGVPLGFGPVNGSWQGPPDLAVEILSPDDRMTRVLRKLNFYLRHGVRVVWVIDPENRTITTMTSDGVVLVLHEDDTLTGGDVLPGFSVPVRELLPPAQADTTA